MNRKTKEKTSMYEALVITPVKDSLNTTIETILSIQNSTGNFHYCIFNDFSSEETNNELKFLSIQYHFELINLSEITDTPSPNYRLVLQMAQQKALELEFPLIIVESDVEVQSNTLGELIRQSKNLPDCGMVASITRNHEGKINFPYLNFKSTKKEIVKKNQTQPKFLLHFTYQRNYWSNTISKCYQQKNIGMMYPFQNENRFNWA